MKRGRRAGVDDRWHKSDGEHTDATGSDALARTLFRRHRPRAHEDIRAQGRRQERGSTTRSPRRWRPAPTSRRRRVG